MDQPIRILHIVTIMDRGGLETMIMNYYRQINRKKFQFDFLVHRMEQGEYEEEIKDLGGIIYRMPKMNPFSVTYRNNIKLFFKQHTEYRIVHCHLNCMSTLPLYYAKKAFVPVRIAHAHCSSILRDIKYWVRLYYRRKIPMVATELFACSQKAGKFMYGKHSFTIMKNAIYLADFSYDPLERNSVREKLHLHSNFVIGHVGRFCTEKNHKFIIDIFQQILQISPEAKLLLVGSGKLQDKIKEMVKNYGIEKQVIFYGNSKQVAKLLMAMDVFLFPSLSEGFPVTLVEAQTSGLKCFISSAISEECVISDYVERIGLEKTAKEWAEQVVYKGKKFVREIPRQSALGTSYDIKENVNWLEKFYFECSSQ